MSRPHIEFIQSQVLEWNKGLPNGPGLAGVTSKTLSIDSESGASTCIINFPEGWIGQDDISLDTDQEFYVLDGSITINKINYVTDDYAHFPSGYVQHEAHSKTGAILLTFFDKEVIGFCAVDSGAFLEGHALVLENFVQRYTIELAN